MQALVDSVYLLYGAIAFLWLTIFGGQILPLAVAASIVTASRAGRSDLCPWQWSLRIKPGQFQRKVCDW